MMMSCKEASRLVASGELENAGVFTRLSARFHRMMCGPCREYAGQLASIGSGAKRLYRDKDPGESANRDLESAILESLSPDRKSE